MAKNNWNKKLDWSIRNWYYKNLLIQNGHIKPQVLYTMLVRDSRDLWDTEFNQNLTVQKVIWQVKNLKYKQKKISTDTYVKRVLEKRIDSYDKDEIWLMLEKEKIKKAKQNTFLNSHFRNELTISTTRNSIVESLIEKTKNKKISQIKSTKSLFSKEELENLTLQHTLTDIHLNEVTERKWNRHSWNTEIWVKTIIKIIDELISKQINSNYQYKNLELLLLWDLIWTQIYHGLLLDIEPVRASKILASTLAKIYKELIKYFDSVEFVLVPWNHSETRKWWEKSDEFQENYDFLVGQYLKEYLSLLDSEEKVITPPRDIPLVSKETWNSIHWFWHWDRFFSDFKKMLPIFSEYNNINYVDYFHEGHFHNEKIRYEDSFLKFTYPCVTNSSFYGQNRFWGSVKRDYQVGNIYDERWSLITTYNLEVKDEEISKLYHLRNINIDTDMDISELFINTLYFLKD